MTIGGASHDRVRRHVWVAGAVAAALMSAVLSGRELWLEPLVEDGALGWLGHPVLALTLWLWLAPLALLNRVWPAPAAFEVRGGRFVAPPSGRLRSFAVLMALIGWVLVPVVMLRFRLVAPEVNLRWVAGVMAVLALVVTVIAVRLWRRAVVLTPQGVVVRPVFSPAVTMEWNRVDLEWAGGRPEHLGVDADFLTRAIGRYRDHPDLRPAIGTEQEHERLLAG